MWDDRELAQEILEEFEFSHSGYGGDVWREQAEAARDFLRQRKTNQRAAQKAAGRCRDCDTVCAPGSIRCVFHLEVRRKAEADRVKQGICVNCDSKAVPNRRRCLEHLNARSVNPKLWYSKNSMQDAKLAIAEAASRRKMTREAGK